MTTAVSHSIRENTDPVARPFFPRDPSRARACHRFLAPVRASLPAVAPLRPTLGPAAPAAPAPCQASVVLPLPAPAPAQLPFRRRTFLGQTLTDPGVLPLTPRLPPTVPFLLLAPLGRPSLRTAQRSLLPLPNRLQTVGTKKTGQRRSRSRARSSRTCVPWSLLSTKRGVPSSSLHHAIVRTWCSRIFFVSSRPARRTMCRGTNARWKCTAGSLNAERAASISVVGGRGHLGYMQGNELQAETFFGKQTDRRI